MAEALFEEPSFQDLIVTPTSGSLVGRETRLQVYPFFHMTQPVDGAFATASEWEVVRVTGLGFKVEW